MPPSWWKNLRLQTQLALAALNEREDDRGADGLPVPSVKLRYRVGGSLEKENFLQVGMQCSQSLKELLRVMNRDFHSFERILDFGCGCGRVLRYFSDPSSPRRLYGTDIDPEAIAWCRAHLPHLAQWDVNDHVPRTQYDSGTFDLIYAISVFTHLDEERQFAWLAELKRISKRGGWLILTVSGPSYYDRVLFPENGFLYQTSRRRSAMFKLRGLPDYYQMTYHTKQYIEQNWSRFFSIKHYVERGMNNHQDAVLLVNE